MCRPEESHASSVKHRCTQTERRNFLYYDTLAVRAQAHTAHTRRFSHPPQHIRALLIVAPIACTHHAPALVHICSAPLAAPSGRQPARLGSKTCRSPRESLKVDRPDKRILCLRRDRGHESSLQETAPECGALLVRTGKVIIGGIRQHALCNPSCDSPNQLAPGRLAITPRDASTEIVTIYLIPYADRQRSRWTGLALLQRANQLRHLRLLC